MIIIFIFIILILSDIYLKIKPKSNLKINPENYKIVNNQLNCSFIIHNSSKSKETMIPNFLIDIELYKNQFLCDKKYKKNIIIDNGDKKIILNNYWPTIILKSNESIKVDIELIFMNPIIDEIEFIWIKLFWENYGHFGLVNKENFYLINLKELKNNNHKLITLNINDDYKVIPIKTYLLGAFDRPLQTVVNYCKEVINKNDILVIGETPLAIMQGRYISPKNIDITFYAKVFCYFFHPTSSLATASGMQLLIDKIGVTRISIALIIGTIFKIVGIKGIFYRLTGSESSLIDDISGTTFPYDKSIVLGPKDPSTFCKDVSKHLNIDVAIVDVNDLGGVKILSSTNKKNINLLKEVLKSNPAGNDDQKTPLLLIRKRV